MPHHNSASRTPESHGKDRQSSLTGTPTQSFPSQRVRVSPSTGSLAGAEDGQAEEHVLLPEAHQHGGAKDSCSHDRGFPAQPSKRSSGASPTAFPAIAAQQRRGTTRTSPRSATTAHHESRSASQKLPRQRGVSRSSVTGTPPRSTETAPLARDSPATTIAGERDLEGGTQRTQKGRRTPPPSTPRTAPPPAPAPTARDSSPVPIATPPPVNFSPPSSSPTVQRSSPCLQVLSLPAPQITLQRTGSRTQPFLGTSLAGSPTSTPRTHTLQSTEPTSPSSCTPPQRISAVLTRSPSCRQTSVPHLSTHSCGSSQNSISAAASIPFRLVADRRDGDNTAAALTSASTEVEKDLLVEEIVEDPHRMGQSHDKEEKTRPPRVASNSRASQEESGSRPQRGDRRPEQTPPPAHASPLRGREARRTPSASPNEKPMPDKSVSPSGAEIDDAHWVFQRPPNNQRTFYFKEDNLEFSSQFDSGNLIQVERVGPLQYRMYTAMDCGNAPWQTNNRQWFHFSLRGGSRGSVVTFTFVGMMHSNMFNFDWMPVAAVTPSRPEYARLPGKAKVEPLENMPETPEYPLLAYNAVARGDADSDGDNNEDDNDGDAAAGSNGDSGSPNGCGAGIGGVAFSISTTSKAGAAGKRKKATKKKKPIAMNLTFDYKIEAEVPVTHTPPRGRPDVVSIYIASNHPYSYTHLQRNLLAWQEVARRSNATRSLSVQAAANALAPTHSQSAEPAAEARAAVTPTTTTRPGESNGAEKGSKSTLEATSFTNIYFHREVLCKTLEGHDVTLLTISDRSRMTMERAPLISEKDGIPHSATNRTAERPFAFTGKKYVVLTARVHPGECPGSHLIHGCIDFLMHRTDPRAAALRHNFVFYVVPMLNPDGVVRGHSRVDANGVDLNRMYRAPSRKRHPAPYSVMALLRSLGDRVALFVDMHAHANKRGTFFYGNSMDGAAQVENLLYAKLVSLNTPYLDFRSCNFSEANMFAVGRSGKGKDSSSRVVVYTEAGVVHGYTIETSHVMAETLNPIVTLVNAQAEELEKVLPAPLQLAHTPATFGDTGRAMLVALLDLKSINPLSRLPQTPYHSTRGVSMWLQRQLQIETAEMLFAQAFKSHGKDVQAAGHEASNNLLGPIMRSLNGDEYPEKITIKKARLLPRTTFSGVRDFLPMEAAVALLAQTAPTGPPRSLLYSNGANGGGGLGRRRGGSPATGTINGVAASSPPVVELPAVIATKRRSRPNASGTDMTVKS